MIKMLATPMMLLGLLSQPLCSFAYANAPDDGLTSRLSLTSVSNDYPPFYSSTMERYGVVYNLVEQVFEHAGYRLHHQFYPFMRAKTLTQKGKADVIVGVWHRKTREEWIAFSKPLLSVNVVLYKRVDRAIDYKEIGDLKSYSIGIGRGYANPQAFSSANLTTEAVSSDIVNLKKLLIGRIDLVLISEEVANYLIESRGSEYQGKFERVGEPLSVEQFHIGVAKSLPNYQQILDDFDHSLESMEQNGQVWQILADHGFQHNDYWLERFKAKALSAESSP